MNPNKGPYANQSQRGSGAPDPLLGNKIENPN